MAGRLCCLFFRFRRFRSANIFCCFDCHCEGSDEDGSSCCEGNVDGVRRRGFCWEQALEDGCSFLEDGVFQVDDVGVCGCVDCEVDCLRVCCVVREEDDVDGFLKLEGGDADVFPERCCECGVEVFDVLVCCGDVDVLDRQVVDDGDFWRFWCDDDGRLRGALVCVCVVCDAERLDGDVLCVVGLFGVDDDRGVFHGGALRLIGLDGADVDVSCLDGDSDAALCRADGCEFDWHGWVC